MVVIHQILDVVAVISHKTRKIVPGFVLPHIRNAGRIKCFRGKDGVDHARRGCGVFELGSHLQGKRGQRDHFIFNILKNVQGIPVSPQVLFKSGLHRRNIDGWMLRANRQAKEFCEQSHLKTIRDAVVIQIPILIRMILRQPVASINDFYGSGQCLAAYLHDRLTCNRILVGARLTIGPPGTEAYRSKH